jgi:hypothetical protein
MAGDGEDGSDASDDQAAEAAATAEAAAAEAASAIGGEVPSGGEGFGGPGFGGGTDIGGETPPGGPVGGSDIGGEQEATLGAFARAEQQAEATRGKVSLQTTLSEKKAVALSAKQQEQPGFWSSLLDDLTFDKMMGFPDESEFSTIPERTGEHYSTSFGYPPATPSPKDETIQASMAALGFDILSPETDPEGVDPIPKRIPKTRAIAARNNSVGLAVEDGDFTPKELRRRRRQITRFA